MEARCWLRPYKHVSGWKTVCKLNIKRKEEILQDVFASSQCGGLLESWNGGVTERLVEIRDALKVASVRASESCFIRPALSYIISWNEEEWRPSRICFIFLQRNKSPGLVFVVFRGTAKLCVLWDLGAVDYRESIVALYKLPCRSQESWESRSTFREKQIPAEPSALSVPLSGFCQ